MTKWWWNDDESYDENYDEIYDEIGVKTASKCLARMKGYWDLEFEPSVEEIVDYRCDMAILSVCFLWQAHTLPIQSSTWQWRSRQGQPAQAAHPNIHVYGSCAVCRCVLVRIMAAYSKHGAILMRDSGCIRSLSCSLHPESQSTKKNSASRWGNQWQSDDEMMMKVMMEIMMKLGWRLLQNMFSSHERLLGPRIRT